VGGEGGYRNLKNGKSCGMDGILNEMIKYGQHALLPCLEKLFNIILSSGTYRPFSEANLFIIPFSEANLFIIKYFIFR
jgi:hypothetical protein